MQQSLHSFPHVYIIHARTKPYKNWTNNHLVGIRHLQPYYAWHVSQVVLHLIDEQSSRHQFHHISFSLTLDGLSPLHSPNVISSCWPALLLFRSCLVLVHGFCWYGNMVVPSLRSRRAPDCIWTPTIGAGFWSEEWKLSYQEAMTRRLQDLSQHTSTALSSVADGLRNIIGDCIPDLSGYRSLPSTQELGLEKVNTMSTIRAVAMSGMSHRSIKDELDRAVSQCPKVQTYSVVLLTLPQHRIISEQVVSSSVLTRRRYQQRRLLPPSLRRSYRLRDRPLLPKPQLRVRRQSDCGFVRRVAKVGWRPLGEDWRGWGRHHWYWAGCWEGEDSVWLQLRRYVQVLGRWFWQGKGYGFQGQILLKTALLITWWKREGTWGVVVATFGMTPPEDSLGWLALGA